MGRWWTVNAVLVGLPVMAIALIWAPLGGAVVWVAGLVTAVGAVVAAAIRRWFW